MRAYEIVVILRADLGEDDLNSLVETISGWITANGGTVGQIDRWGRRRLAYPIARQRDGYYLLINAELSPNTPGEIERNLRITESVLRFLVSRKDD